MHPLKTMKLEVHLPNGSYSTGKENQTDSSRRAVWSIQRLSGILLILCLLAACAPGDLSTGTPSLPGGEGSPAIPSEPVLTQATSGLWVDEAIPEQLRQTALAGDLPQAASHESASTWLVDAEAQDLPVDSQIIHWVYALVAPFPSLVDGVNAEDVRSIWDGNPPLVLGGYKLWMDENTLAVFSALWGQPAADVVHTAPGEDLSEMLWSSPEPGFAILPFEDVEPHWKVMTIADDSPIHKDFDMASYPLVVTFACFGENCAALDLPESNRVPSKLTVVVMTGVTALVRGTAWKMEQNGIDYPGQAIRDWLTEADITHISNEIPFAENCPYPDPNQEAIVFCSNPRYIELLKYVGADVIELTGNHFQDWGSRATLYTLDLYRQDGFLYYGGGSDLDDSRKALKMENNGNRIAFIGCNAPGPGFAWATDSQPGAAPCGDLTWMVDEITRLRSEGFLPIVTFQHYEYYTPEPRPIQEHDFRMVADAGAIIVSGSQAHAAQGMEFRNDTLILYGLGNLFFDQMYYPLGNTLSTVTRQELIARHVIYDNKYISTELLTAMLEEYARPRPMTEEERINFLTTLFAFSKWK
jgi:hypothetical protein